MRWRRRRRLRLTKRGRLWLLLWGLLAVLLYVLVYLTPKGLGFTTELAVNYASDAVQAKVNDAVRQTIQDAGEDGYYAYQTDADGHITAISLDVDRINMAATSLLKAAMETDDENGVVNMEVPLETLLGIYYFPGHPKVPVKVLLLTTSRVDYHNEFTAAAINQSKYQLYLHITVDIDVVLPWCRDAASVESDVLLAETVIIGDVPGTYLELE